MADERDEGDAGPATASLDRRTFERLPPQFASIDLRTPDGNLLRAKVENVSLGGICLRLEAGDGLSENDAVDLIYVYAAMPAVVRHVETYPDGGMVVGLEWSKPPAV